MDGGIEHAARARAIALGIDVELQLEKTKRAGFQPVLFMLREARERAIDAMAKLVVVDSSDPLAIRKLQLEVMLFDDIVSMCREVVENGRNVERQVDEEDRAAINELILHPENWAASEIRESREERT